MRFDLIVLDVMLPGLDGVTLPVLGLVGESPQPNAIAVPAAPSTAITSRRLTFSATSC
jgi:DNA-binding response OmpR family regulator